MELIVIRHLATQDNQEQRFSSGDRDIPIIPDQRIPKVVVDHIKKFELERLTVAHTGLKRSIETARLIMESLHCSGRLLVIPQFKERFGGQFAGLKFSDLQRAFPKLRSPNQFWRIEASNKGLESVVAFLSRIEEGITLLASVVDASDIVVLVAHAGALKGIKAVLTTKEVGERKQILCEPTPHRELFQFHIERR